MQNPSCFSQGVRQGEAGLARRGQIRSGEVRLSKAGMAWLRKFGLRQVRSGKAGAAWLGVVWFCCVRYGGVRRGR